ncbi:MAG: lipid-A-disaccharide synthase [Bacteroidales bacterium]|nr:lipid-A-disaccharide synthase [Bacteroidales bacterium]
MKYYIVVGEASGDLHGSNLMKGLYQEDPEARIRFWGGPLMDAVYREHETGEGLVEDYRAGAVMGLFEVLRKAPQLLNRIGRCKKDIAAWNPDVVILIDYPGFNFKIAEFAHGAGFKVYYYIAPKVWASREGRNRKLKAWVDKLFIVFPFEKEYFQKHGVPYEYAGNPLVDAIASSPALSESRQDFLARTGLPDQPWIALLAGSRSMEINSMMPVFMQLADAWHAARPSDLFVVAAAPSRTLQDYARFIGARDFVKVVFGETYGAIRHAQAAVINSGTASLEAALIGTPQVVGYRMLGATTAMARRVVKVPYISLGNLILNRMAFQEIILENFKAQNLLPELTRLVDDVPYRQKMQADYAEIRQLLGGAGASAAVARAIIRSLKG